ncbi:glycosyltransferase [Clostridium perfringens]|uniref:glycosyltransferase n=1 Tax=Clostridium perfringens TaxID=1502 RepID=UPI0018E421DE|nr:glycosyltransferase [Clostridium perfringens]MBI6027020.1 glycosyltransferase [Clostridium perfringens]
MLISIVVPIYNSEKYLKKCIDSILQQSYTNIEVILINDGSTDNSGKICDKYAKEDIRVKVIHKKNEGVSIARNIGIDLATGKYIGFVDSDDWIDLDMFDVLYKNIILTKSDFSICNYYKEYENSNSNFQDVKDYNSKLEQFSAVQLLDKLLDDNRIKGYLWNKLFDLNIIRDNNIYFEKDVYFCEDLLFCVKYSFQCKNICFDERKYYHYLLNETSITKKYYSDKKLSSLLAIENIIILLKNLNRRDISNKYKTFFLNMNISLLMYGIYEDSLSEDIYIMLKKNLNKFSILDITNNRVKFSCILCRISVKIFYSIWRYALEKKRGI